MGVIGSRQYGGRLLILSRATMASSSLLALGLATQAIAQTVPAPPVRSTIDANGVDLFLGTMNVNGPALTIGQSEPQGMRYFRFNRGSGWSDNVMAALNQAGSLMTVSFGGVADSFTASEIGRAHV